MPQREFVSFEKYSTKRADCEKKALLIARRGRGVDDWARRYGQRFRETTKMRQGSGLHADVLEFFHALAENK